MLLATLLSALSCANSSKLPSPDTESDIASVSEPETESETEPEAQTEPPLPWVAELSERSVYLFEGDTYELNYTVSKSAADGEIVWTSSSDCVTVENGTVHAEKEGYGIISGGGESACVIHVLADDLPTVSVNTGGVAVTSKTEYVDCLVAMDSTNEAFCFEKVSAGIRCRGNSTYSRSKKPYRIKFTSKRNLLGMNEGAECKSWVLLAERYDDSVIRNASALTFASMILKEYSSDFRFME